MDATLRIGDAASQRWDLVVIGAGPAGSMAALSAAEQGASVLLVDRARFPRKKVCGCCLNGAALEILREAGLGEIHRQWAAPRLCELQLATRRRFALIPMKEGVALSRERLDAALVEAAVARGAAFLSETQALAGGLASHAQQVRLRSRRQSVLATARVVIAASGLGSRYFQQKENPRHTTPASRIGAGTVLSHAPAEIPKGRICMACHRDGYVGMVRLEDGRLDVAAALDTRVVKESPLGTVAARIVEDSGLPVPPKLATADWQGTARLSQRRERVYGERYFVVGDAAGYVEPFTGEGMAWALATGRAVAPLALASLERGTVETGPAWADRYRELTGHRMRNCRHISQLLRHPRLVAFAVPLFARWPSLAASTVRSLNASFR